MLRPIAAAWRWLEGIHTAHWLGAIVVDSGLFGAILTWIAATYNQFPLSLAIVVGVLGCASALFFAIAITEAWHRWGPSTKDIPLSEAARLTYEQLRGSVAVAAAERFGRSAEGILDNMAMLLVQNDIVLRGKRPPSTIIERLTISSGRFEDGGKSFYRAGSDSALYTDIVTDKKSFRELLEKLKQKHPDHP